MSKVKVAIFGTVGKSVYIDSAATNGAKIGTNLFMSDGSLATAAKLATYISAATGTTDSGVKDHRLLRGLTLGDDHPQYTRKDTLTTQGDLYVRGTATIERLAMGTDRQLLRVGTTDPAWETVSPVITLGTDLSGSVTLTDLGNGTLESTIVANAVTDTKLRDSVGTSVIGRSAGTTGDPADVAASADNQVLRRDSGVLGFGQITDAYIGNFAEAAQDAVGGILTDTAEIDFMYDDATPTITASIIASSVAFAKIQNIATDRFVGRITTDSGPIETLTGTQATTLLDVFTASLQGLVPPSGGGTANFLRADGTFAVPSGSAPDVSAATFLTENDETATLANSRRVLAGTNITFDDTVSGVRTINASGGGGGSVASVVGTTNEIDVDSADPANPVLSLASAVIASLGSADSAVQPGDLAAVATTGAYSDLSDTPVIPIGADPTGSVGLVAVNGTATTFMRSDGAPALDVNIAPTWTGAHSFTQPTVISSTASSTTSPALRIGGTEATDSAAAVSVVCAGAAVLSLRDSTNDVELASFAGTAGAGIGTVTEHELSLRTASADRLLIRSTGTIHISSSAASGSVPALRIGSTDSTTGTAVFSSVVAGGHGWVLRNTDTPIEAGVFVQTTTAFVGTVTAHDLQLRSSNTTRLLVNASGNIILGAQSALSTSATNGFTYIPTCAGTPTGTPSAFTGKTAMVYDTTNNRLYVYNGAWRSTLLS